MDFSSVYICISGSVSPLFTARGSRLRRYQHAGIFWSALPWPKANYGRVLDSFASFLKARYGHCWSILSLVISTFPVLWRGRYGGYL